MYMRGCIVCVCVVGLDELDGEKGSKDVKKKKKKKGRGKKKKKKKKKRRV